MFFWIEFGLAALAIALAFACPELGASWFQRAEQLLKRLARRQGLAVLISGLAALAVRAALLPVLPIPTPAGDDEFSYLLLADTFAHGRITNPTHSMWVHFESMHVIWQPTYTGIFHPAQGLIMGLGQAVLGHPFWGVWLSMGLMCAAICWMLQGWLPPAWALLGGFLAVIRLGTFSYWANSYWGGAVAATGGALVLGALPRIRRSLRLREALLLGLGFAVLANSRPYEGLFLGLPVAVALGVWAFGKDRPPLGVVAKRLLAPLLLIMVLTGLAMGYYFWRTTGSPWDTPYLVNQRTYGPVYFAWQVSKPLPPYHHATLRNWYVAVRDAGKRSAAAWAGAESIVLLTPLFFFLGPTLGLPLLALILMLPHGLSWQDLSSPTRFLLLVCGTLLAADMLPVLRFLPHYAAPITAAVLALALLGMRRLRSQSWRGRPAGQFITRAVPVVCLLMLALRVGAKPLGLPEPRRWLAGGSPFATWCSLGPVNLERASVLTQLEQTPGSHLVIVRYGPQHPIDMHEWVYNQADVDAAKVIWARDMGPAENQELIDYFPNRRVWLIEADETPPKVIAYGRSNGQ
ncbi:MAG: hypothetical protein ACLP3R_09215 [Candidatus Korobacteraceae bacterium]